MTIVVPLGCLGVVGAQNTRIHMKMEQYIRAIAGTFVLISLLLGSLLNPVWYLFTAFVGLNLIQSAFTKWCLMESFLARLGVREA